MKKKWFSLIVMMAMLVFSSQSLLFAGGIEGVVVDTDYTRKTFRICPSDDACGVTEENVFVVMTTTKFEGARSFGGIKVGDRVSVEGEALNEIVWNAFAVKRH